MISDRCDIETSHITEDQDNSPHDLSDLAGDAPGKPVGTKFSLPTSQLGSLHVIVDVDDGGSCRDH